MKRMFPMILLFALLLCVPVRADELTLDAPSALLMEKQTGTVLFAKDEHTPREPASVTKVMTLLLTMEAIDSGALSYDDTVTGSAHAASMGGSQIWLKEGEQMRVEDLIKAVCVVSGNDAAVALAIEIAGSEEDFARLMNERAEELGCTETNFVTPNGLHDPEHYTTAYDLCRIACAAMRSETFRTIVSTEYYQTQSGDKTRTLKNKNKILWQYDGGNGVKTGFTKAAGRCLVFSAERGGTQLVGVVLKCPGMWDEAKKLLDFGFDNYRTRRLIEAGLRVGFVAVRGGEKKGLELSAKNDILYPLSVDGTDTLRWTLESPDEVAAPVQAGTELGRLKLYCNDEMVYDTALYAAETVEAAAYRFYIDEILERFRAG